MLETRRPGGGGGWIRSSRGGEGERIGGGFPFLHVLSSHVHDWPLKFRKKEKKNEPAAL